MIEVEKKFLLNKEAEKKLLENAEFLVEKVFTDIYYDTKDFSLTTNDSWLRNRAGKWELKLSLDRKADREVDLYDEVEDENEIRKILKIPVQSNMENDLEKDGYSKFCVCKTTRRKYKKDGFGIDIDFVDYNDDFIYELAEIELMVQDKSEMPVATEKIINFAKQNGLEVGYVRGKVIEYLRRKRPEHFMALVKAGVVKPSQV